MRIGELAAAVGVSTRTVRHYHRVGLLPEPQRHANGYRTYGMRDMLRLARARRLIELGLTLAEAGDVLADDEGRELPEILAELDADLARQEEEIRLRRRQLAAMMARSREGRLGPDDAVSEETARLLARIDVSIPDGPTVRRDRELLAMFDGGRAGAVLAEYHKALDDPALAAATAAIYARFDELVDASPDDPRVPALAADMAAALGGELTAVVEAAPPGELDDQPYGAALVGDFPPAQAEVLRTLYRKWTSR
ncbi:MerR family transcriptional regulator [Pseudonocardia sp. TRM90224]|uniref:MerR family transcriptional regulator n=1 Tax=Pseudonocardia sp. TRM90224 TaxID=2812678 RepID=UPI001E5DB399|nr:MerR family transcriptional regulator [Pseudonocardia sp. TRM90224]